MEWPVSTKTEIGIRIAENKQGQRVNVDATAWERPDDPYFEIDISEKATRPFTIEKQFTFENLDELDQELTEDNFADITRTTLQDLFSE